MSNESEREITNEQWMNFAERYVLRSAGLESEVEGLKRELKLADEAIHNLRTELGKLGNILDNAICLPKDPDEVTPLLGEVLDVVEAGRKLLNHAKGAL